jgi:hypothetical protein
VRVELGEWIRLVSLGNAMPISNSKPCLLPHELFASLMLTP